MARERMIYPEMLDSESYQSLSSDAKVLWVALLLMADDYGRGKVCEYTIKGRVFPKDGKISPKMVGEMLDQFVKLDFIRIGDFGLSRYYYVTNWDKYQHLKYRKDSKIPDFPEISQVFPGNFPEISPQDRIGEDRLGEDKIPPSPFKEPSEAEVLRQHVQHFNEQIAPALHCSRVEHLSESRIKALRGRLIDYPDLWDRILAEIPKMAPALRGGASWLHFDFLMSPNNLAKFLDGNYRRWGNK